MIELPEKLIVSGDKKFLLKVEDSGQEADYQKYENLRQVIWDFADDHLSGSRNLMCENFLHEGSSLFLGAFEAVESGQFVFDEAHLVGFSYGFVGLRNKSLGFESGDNLWFYSQYMGVRPDRLSYGLGTRIKEFQKEVLLSVFRLKLVVCTYDPLTAVNAYRNIRQFGMQVLDYRLAPYGEYGGRLNREDVPSDRFFMGWDLLKEHRPFLADNEIEPALSRWPRALESDWKTFKAGQTEIELQLVKNVRLQLTQEFVLVEVPVDFYRLLHETANLSDELRNIPVNWRLQSREVFLNYFGQGYEVVDFLRARSGKPVVCYLLKKKK
ncbi:MAG: hypothetical protein KBC18_02015 [Candidatus Saccharicenans sp.]|nr:hypothetical protein [Candidatus Saccharicenans sp.]